MARSMKWCLAALVTVVLSACGGGGGGGDRPSSPSARCGTLGLTPKIVNGTECAYSPSSPVVPVLIQNRAGQVGLCSGTVLSPTRILTAAHCIAADTRRIGIPVLLSNGTTADVLASRWVLHPGFRVQSDGFYNDAAVVTLSGPLPNPNMALLISDPAAVGQSVFIAGWGEPVYDIVAGNATLSIVNSAHVGYAYSGRDSNTCRGDSGGPLYRNIGGRMGLLGITSTGTAPTCGANDLALFTNIQTPEVLNFIRAQAPEAQIF
ncbi:MAG: trypsin-like serine protease [Hydrogenophaga sp.]|nr:trypsin-like serine protease [Hydrogenophaga sp.]